MLEKLHQHLEIHASRLEIDPADLSNLMNSLDAIYDSASDAPSEIAKNKFRSLAESLNRETSEICRIVARLEADRTESDIQPLVGEYFKSGVDNLKEKIALANLKSAV